MPTYPIFLDRKYDGTATKAASETGLTVQQYIEKILKEHLNRIENQSLLEKVTGK